MKKLLMIAALVGMVCTGYGKANVSSTEAKVQKPYITLSVQRNYADSYLYVYASEPVPETVSCEGQYQAPNNTTGYWHATLSAGSSSTGASGYPGLPVENVPIAFDKIVVGGRSCTFDQAPLETDKAIYMFNEIN